MKRILLVLLLAPLFCFGQKAKIISEVKTDTIISCGNKYLFKNFKRILSDSKRTIEVSDFMVLKFNKLQNDTVLDLKSLDEAEIRNKFQNSEEKDFSEIIYFEKISDNILEIITARSHYFEGAAHGEHWYENAFFDLETRSFFDINAVFKDSAFPVIDQYIRKELKLESDTDSPEKELIKINQYSFNKENLVVAFHYLDADSPVHVSYAQQTVEVYVPFFVLKSFIKKESPVFKMINGINCR